jgi:hypothetical protein
MTADSALPAWAVRLVSEFEAADLLAQSVAKGLSHEQLNWCPWQNAWSVGQCLEHLRMANELYLPAISIALNRRAHAKVHQISLGWFSRWFIRNYIGPDPNAPRVQAPKKIQPGRQVEPFVLDAFLRSNERARELIMRAGDYDVNRIRFKNPFVPGLRLTVGTGLEIVAKHQSRHLRQAENVRQSAGFPVSGERRRSD